jgi:hypothetical protein
MLASSRFSVAGVGYVNILNGQIPSEAFAVERQGKTIIPEGVYTILEEGDVVKPSPGAALLFTPDDTACPAVEIGEVFTASACPGVATDLADLAYDFISDEFMAAPLEEVGMFATRGAEDTTPFTLPPLGARLLVESAALAESLGRSPLLTMVDDKARADFLITGSGADVTLSSPDGGEAASFTLPADETALRRAVLARLNLKTMADLHAEGPWPDGFSLIVEALTTDEAGALEYDGRKWAPSSTTVVSSASPQRVAVPRTCLLRFAFENKGAKPYYAYLVNFTDEGQVLPVLPPEGAAQIPNLIHAGQSLRLPQLNLELGAPVENVRLIVSERPLDLSQFTQDGLEAPKTGKPARMRPIAPNAWQTALVVFTLG